MSNLSEYELNALRKLGESIHEGKWSNDGLVELIKLSGDFLNIRTVPDYCRANSMSYPGAVKPTKTRHLTEIFNVKFIIENS